MADRTRGRFLLPAVNDGDRVGVGRIPEHQRLALESVAPTGADIFKNLDDLNEEVIESHPEYVRASGSSAMSKLLEPPVQDEEDEEDDVVRKLEERLAQERAKALAVKEERLRQEEQARVEAAAKAAKEAPARQPEVEEPPEMTMHERILAMLKTAEGAPTEKQINQWKAQFGDLHVTALGEGDVYIFTPLTRGNWKKIQETAAALRDANTAGLEEKMRETVIQYAVKWPRGVQTPEFFFTSKAGVIDTLYELVMLHSYFLTPQQSMLMTTKL